MKTAATIAFCMIYSLLFAQQKKEVVIRFLPIAEGKKLLLDQWLHPANEGDSFSITTLRFYVSAIAFYQNENKVWEEPNSYHLLDAEVPDQMRISLKVPSTLAYNRLHFSLGIDSTTNEAGAGSGALDATQGMYWAWQSGYINFKLEGTHPACNTRKHAFQFHLGGFRGKDYCLQKIILPVSKNNNIEIITDISRFLNSINMAQQNTVMIPGKEAVLLSQKAAQMFSISPNQ